MRLLPFAVLMTMLVQATAWSTATQGNSKALDGVWLPVEAEMAGAKFPDEVLKAMKLTMTDGKYVVAVGKMLDKGSYKFDASAKPATIDIVGDEGPNKGKTLLAIYELKEDSLRVCYDLDGKKRPAEFKIEPNTKQFLVTYKREKP